MTTAHRSVPAHAELRRFVRSIFNEESSPRGLGALGGSVEGGGAVVDDLAGGIDTLLSMGRLPDARASSARGAGREGEFVKLCHACRLCRQQKLAGFLRRLTPAYALPPGI
jgi:hypothetical protein